MDHPLLKLLAFCLAFVSLSAAQNTLSARVVNFADRPVAGCSVTVANNGPKTVTDAAGRFTLFFPANGIRQPVLPRPGTVLLGSGHFNYLGRWLGHAHDSRNPLLPARKGSAESKRLTFSAKGYPSKDLTLYFADDLDSVVELQGYGIRLLAPLDARRGVLGDTLKVMAEAAPSVGNMKIQFRMGESDPWITPPAPACLAGTSFQDTCSLKITYDFLVSGPEDSLPYNGKMVWVRVSDIGDSVIHAASEGILFRPKNSPELLVPKDTIVSIGDTVYLEGGSGPDPSQETLTYSWKFGTQIFPYTQGRLPILAPMQGDTTLRTEFRATRADQSSYTRSMKIDVVWDYPSLIPQRDTSIGLHTPTVLHAEAFNQFGGIKKFEWDFGATGNWIATAGNSVAFPGLDVLNPAYPVNVRVTDDDGLIDTASFKLNITVPHLTEGFISDVLPRPDKSLLYVGLIGYNILFGQADSLGRFQWSKRSSRGQPWHSADYSTVKMLLNDMGDVSMVTRSEISSNNTQIRLRRVTLAGDSIWEKSIALTHTGYAVQLLQEPGTDYLIPYVEFFEGKLARMDATGNLKWNISMPVFRDLYRAELLANGNLLLCGLAMAKNASNQYMAAAAEITPAGAIAWSRTYDYPGVTFKAIAEHGSGYRFVGTSSANGSTQFCALRTDASGVVVDTVNTTLAGSLYIAASARAADGGTMYVCPVTATDNSSKTGMAFVKFNSAGVLQSEKFHSAEGSSFGTIASLQATADGGFVACGRGFFTAGTLWIVDATGTLK